MDSAYQLMGCILNVITDIYLLGKIQGKKIDLKNHLTYILIVVLFGLIYLNYYYFPGYLRMVFLVIYLYFISIILYKTSKLESLVSSVFTMLMIAAVELLLMILITIVFKDLDSVYTILLNSVITNVIISLGTIIIVNLKIVNVCFKKVLYLLRLLGKYKSLVYSFVILMTINLYLIIYYKEQSINNKPVLVVILVLSVIYVGVMVLSAINEYKYKKMSDKYNLTINTIKEYEGTLNRYRVSNHENKNQLLMIRNMVKSKTKGIDEYIDKIIDNKLKDDEKIFYEVSKVPAGGLRATIYSKLLKMKEKNIDYNIEVSGEASTFDPVMLSNDTILDICNVLSIFLDNAIEESENNKDKEITYEVYLEDNYVIINVSNVIERNIDLTLLNKEGYTTKKEGHGYGLSLATKIIKNNGRLENNTMIEDDLFIQELKIRID